MNIKNTITSIAFAILVVIAGCKKDTYKEIKGLCPKVLSTIPSNGSTSVPLNQVISILFNEEMDPATMNTNTITIDGKNVYRTRENMGRALGVGFCYVATKIDTEFYLYINIWKYNLSIGRFYH
jgi:hypothetical protein